MRTNITDVYCAGDLTSFPLKMAKGQNVSIGHWQTAQAHGNQRCVYLLILPTFRIILTYRHHKANRRELKDLKYGGDTPAFDNQKYSAENMILKNVSVCIYLFIFPHKTIFPKTENSCFDRIVLVH